MSDIELILSGNGPHKLPAGVEVVYIQCIQVTEPVQIKVVMRMANNENINISST